MSNIGPTGFCPDCGTSLRKATFVDCWAPDGSVSETTTEWECSECKVRWSPVYVDEKVRVAGVPP
jgi:hypothetical protein